MHSVRAQAKRDGEPARRVRATEQVRKRLRMRPATRRATSPRVGRAPEVVTRAGVAWASWEYVPQEAVQKRNEGQPEAEAPSAGVAREEAAGWKRSVQPLRARQA